MATIRNTRRREKPAPQSVIFPKFARNCVRVTEHPVAFGLAVVTVVIWAVTGPLFNFSDSWQLVINTATSIITFLMVFLILNTQNRDTEAIQLKLAELIQATQTAHNAFLNIEELSEEELDQIKASLRQLAAKANEGLRTGEPDPAYLESKLNGHRVEPAGWDIIDHKATSRKSVIKHQTKEYV